MAGFLRCLFSKIFIAWVCLGTILFQNSCSKEDEVATKVVYGKPDQPMVFNLKVFDPSIGSKGIQIDGYNAGEARLVANDSYIIYEPGPDFEYDQVNVIHNGNPIARVIFFSEEANPDCNAMARYYKIEVKKNSGTLSTNAFVNFCNLDVPSGRSVSVTDVIPINNFDIAIGSGSIQLVYTPAADFVGHGEYIYEVGAVSNPSIKEIHEADYVLSGLVQIYVSE